MIRIVIIDDHKLFREGLIMLINSNSSKDIDVVGEASTGYMALKLIDEVKPDIALIDLNMPLMSGLDLISTINSNGSTTKIIALTAFKDPITLHMSFQFGAKGFILKDDCFDDLIIAIKTVYADKTYKSKSIESDDDIFILVQQLTKRECEIFKMLTNGFTIKDLSEALNISKKTVENHRTNIMEKLNIHSSIELVRYGYKIGLNNL